MLMNCSCLFEFGSVRFGSVCSSTVPVRFEFYQTRVRTRKFVCRIKLPNSVRFVKILLKFVKVRLSLSEFGLFTALLTLLQSPRF